MIAVLHDRLVLRSRATIEPVITGPGGISVVIETDPGREALAVGGAPTN